MISQDDNQSSGLCLTKGIQQLDRRAEPKVTTMLGIEGLEPYNKLTDSEPSLGVRQSQISLPTFIEIV